MCIMCVFLKVVFLKVDLLFGIIYVAFCGKE